MIVFDTCNMADDRRRTGASMPDSHHHQPAYGLDLFKERGVLSGVAATTLDPEFRLHVGHMGGEPFLHLHQQFVAIVEGDVDEIDGLAVEALRAWREGLELGRRWKSGRVQHGIQAVLIVLSQRLARDRNDRHAECNADTSAKSLS